MLYEEMMHKIVNGIVIQITDQHVDIACIYTICFFYTTYQSLLALNGKEKDFNPYPAATESN